MDLLLILAAAVVVWLASKGAKPQAPAAPGISDGNGLDNITEAIARMEGFYKNGSLAQRTNNPGDVGTFGSNVASYSDVGDGWDAVTAWVQTHITQHPDWDFYDMAHYYLTGSTTGKPGPKQNPDAYAEYVANYLGVDPTTPVSSVIG